MYTWNLDSLYKGFDEKFYSDVEELEKSIEVFIETVNKEKGLDAVKYIESVLKIEEKISILSRTLFSFASLTNATDIGDEKSLVELSKLSNIVDKMTKSDVIFARFIEKQDLEKLAEKSDLISLYIFNLNDTKKNAKHLLTEKEEILYSKIDRKSVV